MDLMMNNNDIFFEKVGKELFNIKVNKFSFGQGIVGGDNDVTVYIAPKLLLYSKNDNSLFTSSQDAALHIKSLLFLNNICSAKINGYAKFSKKQRKNIQPAYIIKSKDNHQKFLQKILKRVGVDNVSPVDDQYELSLDFFNFVNTMIDRDYGLQKTILNNFRYVRFSDSSFDIDFQCLIQNDLYYYKPLLSIPLEDDNTDEGGIAYSGETVEHYLFDVYNKVLCDHEDDDSAWIKVLKDCPDELNSNLVDSGIKPLPFFD